MPGRGEAPRLDWQEVEAVTATAEPESPAPTEHLMEAICDSDNIETALRAVVRNKGAPGVDGITVQQLPGILKRAGLRSKINCSRGVTSRSRCVG
jgi:RNA-directed DNA polymerase